MQDNRSNKVNNNKDRAGAFDNMFLTVTMAEVLETQGKLEDALAIYTVLSRTRPGDGAIAESIARLKRTASGERNGEG